MSSIPTTGWSLVWRPSTLTGCRQPDIRPTTRGWYVLWQPYSVTVVAYLGRGKTATRWVNVPRGFKLDGASIPRALWSLSGLRPDGLIRAAAVVHDYLYQRRGVLHDSSMDRESADGIFLDLMLAAGMKPWRAKLAWKAVRLFGPRW